MDFDFRTERGNEAFPEIIRDSIFTWVRPVELIDTIGPTTTVMASNYPNSMLDLRLFLVPQKIGSQFARSLFVMVIFQMTRRPAITGRLS